MITASLKDFQMKLMKFLLSAKALSSILQCEVLIVIPDGYDFEFSIKGAERKRRTENSTHIQEIEIIDNRKFPKSFQSYLENS